MSDLVKIACCECRTNFAMEREIYNLAEQRGVKFDFYCPHGHRQYIPKGDTDLVKMRRERDQAIRDNARLTDAHSVARARTASALKSASAYKGAATRLRNRALAGICPCCNRHFKDVESHVKSKHSVDEMNALITVGQPDQQ